MASTPEQPRKRVISFHPREIASRSRYNYDGPQGKPTYTSKELVTAFTETAPACHHAPHVIFEQKVKAEVYSGLSKIEEYLKDPS